MIPNKDIQFIEVLEKEVSFMKKIIIAGLLMVSTGIFAVNGDKPVLSASLKTRVAMERLERKIRSLPVDSIGKDDLLVLWNFVAKSLREAATKAKSPVYAQCAQLMIDALGKEVSETSSTASSSVSTSAATTPAPESIKEDEVDSSKEFYAQMAEIKNRIDSVKDLALRRDLMFHYNMRLGHYKDNPTWGWSFVDLLNNDLAEHGVK